MAMEIESARLLVWKAAWMKDQKEKVGLLWFLRAATLAGLKRYDEAIDSLIAALPIINIEETLSGSKFSVIDSFLALGRAEAIKKHPRWKHLQSIIQISKKSGRAK